MRWRDNPWVLAGVLLAGTLAIGGISFLLTGLLGPGEGGRPARLAPDTLMELEGGPVRLLSLKRGSGTGSSVNDTLQYVFVSGEHVFLADMNPKTLRPRMRWFDRQGKLAGTYACPVGATNFAPLEGGFSFILAPGAKRKDEIAAVYSLSDSRLTTYAIPATSGSAGLVEYGGVLYSQVDDSLFDVNAQSVDVEGRLVPVAEQGNQLDEETSREGILNARHLGANGRLYNRSLHAIAGAPDSQVQTIRDVETSITVQIPPSGEFLGVDGAGLAYVRVLSERATSPSEMPGISRKRDAVALVLVADMTGTGQWVLPVEEPHLFPYSVRLFSVVREGLVAVRVTERTVDILLYRRRAQ